jgi:hypothetical protein
VELSASLQDLRERVARIEAEHAGALHGGEVPTPDRESSRAGAPPLQSRRFVLPRGIWLIVAGVALLAGAVAGYYVLDRQQTAHVRGTSAVVGGATEDPAGLPAVPPTGAPTASAEAASSTSLATPPSAAGPGGSQAAAPDPPIAGLPAAEQGSATSSPTARPRSESEVTETSALPREAAGDLRIVAPPPTRLGPCTEAVAALGLCTLEQVQRKD